MAERLHADRFGYIPQGHRLYRKNRFQEAERAFDRELSAAPANSAFLQQRARIRMFTGRWEEADADLGEAFRHSRGDPWFLSQWLALLLLRGSGDRIRSLLSLGVLSGPEAGFWRACLECRARRYAAARRGFESAAAAAGDARLRESAELFAWASWALAQPAAVPGPGIQLAGLGYRKVLQMSVGALQALRGCDSLSVVCNADDDLLLNFLGLLPIPLNFLVFRGTEREARKAAGELLDRAGGGRRAGMVTRGHPLVFGLLAGLVLEECRGRGISCRVWGAVSGYDELPALSGAGTGGLSGLQVAGCYNLDGMDPRLPLVVYAPHERRGLKAMADSLSRLYPGDHLCHLLANSGPMEFSSRPVPVRGLRARLAGSIPCALYVPCLS